MQKNNPLIKFAFINKKLTNKHSSSHLLFSNFAELWLKTKRKNIQINTYDDYVYEIKNVKKYFDTQKLKIKDIKPGHIDGFFNFLYQNGSSTNTILHYFVLLNQIFKFAVKNDVINFNVMDKVERPKKTKYQHSFYTANQLQKMLDVLETENSFLNVPITLAAIYGLRRSEIIGLQWNSIDFENKKIYIDHKVIETNKNGKNILYTSTRMKTETSKRVLPLMPNAERILLAKKQEILENQKKLGKKYLIKNFAYVCVDPKGKLISPHRLTIGFAKFLKKYNLPKIRFHDLRHSCASLLVANGISIKAVQEWLGHANYGTTANTYSHLDFSAKEQSANKIEEIISHKQSFDVIKKDSGIYNKNDNIQQNNDYLYNLLQNLIQKIDNLQIKIDKLV